MSHATVKPPPPLGPIGYDPPQHRGHVRSALGLLLAAVAVGAMAASAAFLLHDREMALAEASLRVEASARLIEDQVLRSFRSTDFILGQAIEVAKRHPKDSLGQSNAIWMELSRLAKSMPEEGLLSVVDASGKLVTGTLQFPAKPTEVNDRAYFQAHKQQDRPLFIGPSVRMKHDGSTVFHISRRMTDDATGAFAGAVVASIRSSLFADFINRLPLGTKGTVGIYGLDGRVVLRQPDPDAWVSSSIAGSALLRQMEGAPSGTIVTTSPLDGVERLQSFRVMPDYDVVVTAGMAMEDIVAPWRRHALLVLAFSALGALVVAALAMQVYRSVTRTDGLHRELEEAVRLRTEEKRAQAAEATRTNEGKSRFLAAASHDLRQPLQAAGMFVEVLATRLEGTPHLTVVEKLRQSIDATNSLLNSLLDVSTLEAGRITPNIASVPLMNVFANLADQIQPELAAKKLELRVVETSLTVVSDPVLLERILRNLLVNACRYTERGSVLLGCRLRHGAVAIQVVDTGPGISADKLDEIFEDFTRLGDNGAGSSRGLGLGLGVVRRMAQLLGHDIRVHSRLGRGSTFTVVVPLAPAAVSRRNAALELTSPS